MLDKWCKKTWLYVLYIVGVIMTIISVLNWHDWEFGMRFIAINTIILPFHVFEEWQFPAGFHYQYNLMQKSKYPDRYPMNRLTDMLTNSLAEIYFILLLIIGVNKGMILGITVFCYLEVIAHTLFGAKMHKRYKNKGKKTIYGPGSVTAYAGFGIAGAYSTWYLIQNGITMNDCLIGGIVLLIMYIGVILIPENSFKKEDSKFAFPSAGYFEKFIKGN